MTTRRLAIAVSLLALAGCERKLEGPAPTLASATPTSVCTEQLTTTVTLAGEGLSPLVTDSLTKDPKLNLPQVTLVPQKTLTGDAASGDGFLIPDDATAPQYSRVTWTSQEQLTVQVFPELAVTPGLYTVHVANKNGKTVDLPSAILAVPPPTLAKVEADLLCKDQDNTVTLTGDFFLQIGDLKPTVAVGPKTFDPKSMGGCRDLPGPQGVKACTSMTLAIPTKSLESGTHVITVKNPQTAACSSTASTVTLTFVPCPTLGDVKPDLTCTAEGTRGVTVSGTGFLSVDGRTPTLNLGTEKLPTTLLDCTDVTGVGLREVVKSCSTAKATIPQGALSPTGTFTNFKASVTNPTPADCTTLESVTFTTVPQPTVASLVPDLTCTNATDTTVIVNGTGFLTIKENASSPLAYPRVAFGTTVVTPTAAGGCTDVTGPLETVQSCTSLTLTIARTALPPSGAFSTFAVKVTNPAPADCSSQQSLSFTTVPPPAVTSIVPDLVCTASGSVSVTVNGTGFLTVQADPTSAPTLPVVAVGAQNLTPTGVSGCTAVTGPTETVQSCTAMTVALPQGLAATSYAVAVTNPAPAACSSNDTITVAVADPPVISSLTPDIATAANAPVTATLTGTGFLSVGGALPSVQLGPNPLTAAAVSNCTPVTGTTSGAQRCTTLTFAVPQGTTPGEYQVFVVNPAPAPCASNSVKLYLAPAPTLTRLVPPGLCSTGTGAVAVGVEGQGFFRIGGTASPSVTIGTGGLAQTYALAVDPASCTAVSGYSQAIEACTKGTISVGATDFAGGTYGVVLANPAPVAAPSTQAVSFVSTAPPTLSGVTPSKLCRSGGSLTLTGTNFTSSMQVNLLSSPPVTGGPVSLTGTTSATSAFAGPLTVGGPYDVQVVTAAGSCNATRTGQITVTDGPVVFFMDPSVVFNGITTQATVYASGFAASGLTVGIRPNGTTTVTTLTATYNPVKANRINVTLPAGLAVGSYDVIVTDAVTTQCPGVLLNAFKVVSTTSVTLTGITPPFGYTGGTTAVTLTTNPASGGFKPVPRVYLNPSASGAVAIPLSSVSLIDASRATAVVPATPLPGGTKQTYGLIVVNPDGTVGVLANAFTVLPDPTPFIDSVAPALVVSGSAAAPIKISGGNFRAPTASAVCKDSAGNPLTPPAVTVLAGATATLINATINTSALPNSSVCVLRVTNSDQSYAEYSAIVVTNPASKPSGFKPGPALGTGRRGLVATGASITRASQALFAIGGDNGAATPVATATVESAPLDVFGVPGTFTPQRSAMTVPRSLATGARIGRYLYVAGGRSGTTVHATVERSYLLDPKDQVEVTDVDFTPRTAAVTLAPGVYTYRVAAVMGAADAFNPSGENLPSDPFPVSVPSIASTQIDLTLHWNAVPGATGYRVYRSVLPNAAAGTERLLASVTAPTTQLLDDGTVTPAGASPLPLGSTGTWNVVATMPQGREGAASAGVTISSSSAVFYVVGGRGPTGTDLASVLRLPLTLNTDGLQTVGTLAASANALGTARWQLAGLLANAANASTVGTAQYVYATGGLSGGGTTNANEAALVQSNGELGPWTSSAISNSPLRAGAAAALTNDLVLLFGGKGAAPDATGSQGQLASPAPALGNFSSTSGQLSVARSLAAGAQQGAFTYVLGGTSGAGALTSTEQLTW